MKKILQKLKNLILAFLKTASFALGRIKKILSFIKPENKKDILIVSANLAVMLGTSYMYSYFNTLSTKYNSHIFDSSNPNRNEFEDLTLIAAYSILSYELISLISSPFSNLLTKYFNNAGKKVTLDFLKRLHASDNNLFNEYNKGEILELLNKVSSTFHFLPMLVVYTLPSILNLGIDFYNVFKKGDKTLIGTLITLSVLQSFASRYIKKILDVVDKKVLETTGRKNDLLKETIDELPAIKQLLDQKTFSDRLNKTLDNSINVDSEKAKIQTGLFVKDTILSMGFMLFLRMYAYKNYSNDDMKELEYSIMHILSSVNQLFSNFSMIYTNFKNLNDFFHMEEKLPKRNNWVEIKPEGNPKISVKGVSFFKSNSNGDQSTILKDINITFHPNQVTVIVGLPGSGKSTLGRLISREYPYQEGLIKFFKHPIRQYDLDTYNQFVSGLPQKPIIFKGESLAFNITCGAAADKEELIKIIKLCHLEELIAGNKDPESVQIGGKNGIEPSGGQAQLISFARALLKKDTQVIIYDEAFSAVGKLFEKLAPTIKDFNCGKTVIWITHLPEQLKHIVANKDIDAKIKVFQVKNKQIEQINYKELINNISTKEEITPEEKNLSIPKIN